MEMPAKPVVVAADTKSSSSFNLIGGPVSLGYRILAVRASLDALSAAHILPGLQASQIQIFPDEVDPANGKTVLLAMLDAHGRIMGGMYSLDADPSMPSRARGSESTWMQIVDHLLTMGVDPWREDDRERSALDCAMIMGWCGLVPRLLALPGSPPVGVWQERLYSSTATEPARPPLHQAAKDGRPAFVTTLLEAGAAPDFRDPLGNTPLHLTTKPTVVAALLSGGADPYALNSKGQTVEQVWMSQKLEGPHLTELRDSLKANKRGAQLPRALAVSSLFSAVETLGTRAVTRVINEYEIPPSVSQNGRSVLEHMVVSRLASGATNSGAVESCALVQKLLRWQSKSKSATPQTLAADAVLTWIWAQSQTTSSRSSGERSRIETTAIAAEVQAFEALGQPKNFVRAFYPLVASALVDIGKSMPSPTSILGKTALACWRELGDKAKTTKYHRFIATESAPSPYWKLAAVACSLNPDAQESSDLYSMLVADWPELSRHQLPPDAIPMVLDPCRSGVIHASSHAGKLLNSLLAHMASNSLPLSPVEAQEDAIVARLSQAMPALGAKASSIVLDRRLPNNAASSTLSRPRL
jgi:hypothetical protein